MLAVWDILAYAVLPLWVMAGFADYCCHRASRMARATGLRENLPHWPMLVEVMLPFALALFFRIDALVWASCFCV